MRHITKLLMTPVAEGRVTLKRISKGLIAATLFVAAGTTAFASSHREALAILNEPCADNTDTYGWVSNSTHDKLYLIMDFYPLHEPGQGNHGLRAEGTRRRQAAPSHAHARDRLATCR